MREATPVASGPLVAIAVSVVLSMACTNAADESWPADVIVQGAPLSIGAVRSIAGSYGVGCADRSGNWSVLVDPTAIPDNELLSVIMNNSACALTLSSIRTTGGLYSATPTFVLSDAYQASASSFKAGAASVEFYANAKLSALGFAADFSMTLLVSANSSLDDESRAALYTYPVLIAADSPVSYWRLDETGAATTATDSKGANNGTYANSPTLGVTGALTGSSSTAAQFDGVNDYISISRQISDDFSIEFWFKSTQGLSTGSAWYNAAGLVDGEVGGVTNDFGISLRSDGRILAGVGNPDVTIVSTSSGFNNGQWHHVVVTRTRSTGALRLYVDGQSQGSATGGTQALNTPSNLNLGRLQTAINYYAGALDEIAIYSTVLTAAQVLKHYQTGH